MKLQWITSFFTDRKRRFSILARIGLLNCLSDQAFLKLNYKIRMGKPLNLNDPKTFNEKIQWLKLNDRKTQYSNMVDKYEVKRYVANRIGEDYIIPTLGVWNQFEDIDFDSLPNKFVLKCTHDSGGIVLVSNKATFDKKQAQRILNKFLKRKYYNIGREWPYKNVKPRIIAEEYLRDTDIDELRDYKFFCFNGRVEFFKIDFDRFTNHRANYYNRDGKLLPFGEANYPPDFQKKLKMPVNLNEMIYNAEVLSHNFSFLRVDFYEVNGKIYFGELTFYPASGTGKFVPEEWDMRIGELLKLC